MSKLNIEGINESYNECIKVSIAFVVLSYGFLSFQSFAKFYLYFKLKEKDPKVSLRKIKYNNTDPIAIVSDRTAGNLIEQSVLFMSSLWLCAVFYSADYAGKVGWIWLISRSYYPFVFNYGIPWLLLSTVPGYICIVMLLQPLVSIVFLK